MKKIVIILIVMLSAVSYGQRKYAADRYFKEFDYKKSAELYHSLYVKGDDSYLVISRLADSYYFNNNFEKAEKWYKKLMDDFYPKNSLPNHVFRYAQTLKSNGKVSASDEWLIKLKQISKEDSRVAALENNKDYFSQYNKEGKNIEVIHNLETNTKYSDFGGFIFNNQLYFASSKPKNKEDKRLYNWNKQPYLNVYTANQNTVLEDDVLDVSEAELLNDLSSPYHESNMIITKDGKTAYFTRDNYDGKKLKGDDKEVSHLKIYRTKKVGDKWQKAVELPFNSDAYSTGHPALSIDEKTLYFVSDRPGGFGGTDLYKISILANSQFGKVENLGKNINTEGREMFPFVANDNTLFFASDGLIGLGALDIFEAKLENENYGNPSNLGVPVNGPYDDFAFIITEDEDRSYGYFSSNRKEGKGDDDIYSFTIDKCDAIIAGIAIDKTTKKPLAKVVVNLLNENGAVIATQTSKEDGSYNFEKLSCETKFSLTGEKQDYRSTQTEAKTLNIDKHTVKTTLELENLIVENQIVIGPIYFDFDLYNIREDAEYELENIVKVLKNHPDMVIKIESHTDSRGYIGYNEKLSQRRARSTKDYILSRGIPKTQIESAIGYGESRLLNHCSQGNKSDCTEEEHQINRRSYFIIIKGGENVKIENQ